MMNTLLTSVCKLKVWSHSTRAENSSTTMSVSMMVSVLTRMLMTLTFVPTCLRNQAVSAVPARYLFRSYAIVIAPAFVAPATYWTQSLCWRYWQAIRIFLFIICNSNKRYVSDLYVIVVKISDMYTMNNNVESNDHLFVQRFSGLLWRLKAKKANLGKTKIDN